MECPYCSSKNINSCLCEKCRDPNNPNDSLKKAQHYCQECSRYFHFCKMTFKYSMMDVNLTSIYCSKCDFECVKNYKENLEKVLNKVKGYEKCKEIKTRLVYSGSSISQDIDVNMSGNRLK